MAGERVAYREAGEAMREALRRASEAELSLTDRKVLDAVLVATVSYSKLDDRLPLAQIVTAAGCSARQAQRSLQRLPGLGIVVYAPGRGRGNVSLVGLPKRRQLSVSFPAAKKETGRAVKGDRSRPEKVTHKRAREEHLEVKLREEVHIYGRPIAVNALDAPEVFEPSEALAERVLVAFNRAAGATFQTARWRVMIEARVREHPELDLDAHEEIIERNFSNAWWDTPTPSVLYKDDALFEQAMHAQPKLGDLDALCRRLDAAANGDLPVFSAYSRNGEP